MVQDLVKGHSLDGTVSYYNGKRTKRHVSQIKQTLTFSGFTLFLTDSGKADLYGLDGISKASLHLKMSPGDDGKT